nr:hypothetical protein [Tanacetum cinerariifolium]
MDQSFRNDVV